MKMKVEGSADGGRFSGGDEEVRVCGVAARVFLRVKVCAESERETDLRRVERVC